jgi:hypothetical protein
MQPSGRSISRRKAASSSHQTDKLLAAEAGTLRFWLCRCCESNDGCGGFDGEQQLFCCWPMMRSECLTCCCPPPPFARPSATKNVAILFGLPHPSVSSSGRDGLDPAEMMIDRWSVATKVTTKSWVTNNCQWPLLLPCSPGQSAGGPTTKKKKLGSHRLTDEHISLNLLGHWLTRISRAK